MATTEELTARLAEAELAYHQISLGGGVKRIQHEGRLIEYNQSNIKVLARYIADLRRLIAGVPSRRGGILYVQPQ